MFFRAEAFDSVMPFGSDPGGNYFLFEAWYHYRDPDTVVQPSEKTEDQ